MAVFNPVAAWRKEWDVRDWSDWLDDLCGGTPNGRFWALIAPRRSGKTWMLQALAANQNATFTSLKGDGLEDWNTSHGEALLLVDEPGVVCREEPRAFLRRCREHHEEGTKVVVAMAPGEWSRLQDADGSPQTLDLKDVRTLPALSPAEAELFARRAEWGKHVLDALPEEWRRNAYLLALVLSVAEKKVEVRDSMTDLCKLALGVRREEYVRSVLYEGLSVRQRDALRSIAGQSTPRDHGQLSLLARCGLVDANKKVILDPILRDHFGEPLVLHHVSDVHIGMHAAVAVDGKDTSPQGQRLAVAAGPAFVRDRYVEHVRADPPHLMVISGDIVEKGDDEDLFSDAVAWVGELREIVADREHSAVSADTCRVLLVGGNHDVDWTRAFTADVPEARHHAFAAAFETYPHPHLEVPAADRSASVVHLRGGFLSVFLLGSAQLGGEAQSEPADVLTLLGELSTQGEDGTKQAEKLRQWLRFERIDPGLVHDGDLERLKVASKNAEPVRIAVIHHPVSPLPSTPEIARYVGLVNAGLVKDALFASGIQLVLHGHQHSGWFAVESWPGRHDGCALHIAAAPSLGSWQALEKPGYNEIRIFAEGDVQYVVEVTRRRLEGANWVSEGEPMVIRVPGPDANWSTHFG